MTNKLNNAIRKTIAHAVLKHRFDSVIVKLQEDFATLATDVYDLVFSGKTRTQIDALPEGWLPMDDDIMVQLGASTTRLKFNGAFTHRYGHIKVDGAPVYESELHRFISQPDNILRRFPNYRKGQCVATFMGTDAVTLRYDELMGRKETLLVSFMKAQKEIGVVLSKFTTIDKLVNGWPEVEPFTQNIRKPEPPQLPMVPVQQLNEMLGLPV